MNISDNGLEFIKKQEGCRLKAYDDVTGKTVGPNDIVKGTLTIGVGHTGKDVKKGMVITQKQANDLLKQDLAWVEKTIRESVKVPLTQNQYDALCSFIFNIGTVFKTSTLLKKLNKGDYKGASECFKDWHRGNGLPHILDARRKTEKELFLKSSTPEVKLPYEVRTKTDLHIRKGPNAKTESIRVVPKGTILKVWAVTTQGTQTWGKNGKEYFCLDYCEKI